MENLLLPQAPSLDEPLEILEACHDRICKQLNTLNRLYEHLATHGADEQAQQAAHSILHYFETAGINHHTDEEVDLFPKLREHAHRVQTPGVIKLIEELLAEHVKMAEAVAAIRPELLAISKGSSQLLSLDKVTCITERYLTHIDKENGQLLPIAHSLLTTAEINELSIAMTERRKPK